MNFDLDGDGLLTDGEVAEFLRKHRRTLRNWDSSAKLKALGWPGPILLNGYRHRSKPALRAFIQNAATTVKA